MGSLVHGEVYALKTPAVTLKWLDAYEGILPGRAGGEPLRARGAAGPFRCRRDAQRLGLPLPQERQAAAGDRGWALDHAARVTIGHSRGLAFAPAGVRYSHSDEASVSERCRIWENAHPCRARRAATPRYTPNGSATPTASGPRPRAPSTGTSPGTRSSTRRRPVRPLVRRRRVQHRLQRPRPARGARPGRAEGAHLRQPGHRHEAQLHLRASCATRWPRWAACAAGFRRRKGDRVILYMPMIPEAVIAMLACARIGAVHSVVFGGFAAPELATRIDDAQPRSSYPPRAASSPAACPVQAAASTPRSISPSTSRARC